MANMANMGGLMESITKEAKEEIRDQRWIKKEVKYKKENRFIFSSL